MILDTKEEQDILIKKCDLALKNCGIAIYPFVQWLLSQTRLKEEPKPEIVKPVEEEKKE